MKLKIDILTFRDTKELNHKTSELRALVELFGLELEKAEMNPEGNIFVVQLPKDVLYMNVLQHGVVSFCFLKGHSCEFRFDSYPSEKF